MSRTPAPAEITSCLRNIADSIQKGVIKATYAAVSATPRMSEIVLIAHTRMRDDALVHLGRPKGVPVPEMPGTTTERLRVVLPEVAALLREAADDLTADPNRNEAASDLVHKISRHFRYIVDCHRQHEDIRT